MNLLEIYSDGRIILDGDNLKGIVGKHSIWIPEIQTKFVWSFNGKITSFRDWWKGRDKDALESREFGTDSLGFDKESLRSIENEKSIFDMLSGYQFAPPTGPYVYAKNVQSDFFRGTVHCDPIGIYGYRMANAHSSSEGSFNYSRFKSLFIDTGVIKASKGALGDVKKRGNIVNGYLVDIRRTLWDMMQLREDLVSEPIGEFDHVPNRASLQRRIAKFSQFPHMERKKAYQSYPVRDKNRFKVIKGSRDTRYRLKTMGIPKDLSGKSVLDLGCNLGAFCCEMYLKGARKIVGLDYEQYYINCARDLARYNGFQINYMQQDLTKTGIVANYVKSYFKEPIDIVLALSLYKHIGDYLFDLLKTIEWKECYVESNNAPEGLNTDHVKRLLRGMARIDCEQEFIGMTTDRSPRCVWRLRRNIH